MKKEKLQTSLFNQEDLPKTRSKDLFITKNAKKPVLSKEQRAFNRLVKNVEALQKDLEHLKQSLDKKVKIFSEKILPLEKEIFDIQAEGIKLFYKHYVENKSLHKEEKKALRAIIEEMLENIVGETEPDKELKNIYKKLFGVSYEKALEEEQEDYFQEMKSGIESMFQNFGFDVNLDDLHSKMTDEEIAAKMHKMEADFQKQFSEKEQPKRKKSKREQAKEEKEKQTEAAKSKNIGSVYKQLAKLFHPDLEPDADLKLEKEELMKQLVAAYENNDLHSLLKMELQWIHKEESNIAELTDEKLKIYNDALKEQIQDLSAEIQQTMLHPQYRILHDYVNIPFQIRLLNAEHVLKDTERKKKAIRESFDKLQGTKETTDKELKKQIKIYQQEQEQASSFDDNDDFDHFQDILEHLMNTPPNAKNNKNHSKK